MTPDIQYKQAHSVDQKKVSSLRNHNVLLTLVVVFISACADALWAGTVLAAYLYIKTGDSNAKVGYAEAASGLSMLVAALPVGYVADKYGREKACLIGAFFLLVANGVTTWTISQDEAYFYIIVAMCFWGVGTGVVSGPVQALFADSIPTGSRSRYYVYLFACELIGETVGPAVTIIIFEFDSFGDWTLAELRLVIYAGMGLEFCVAILMLFFDDSKALGEEADQSFAMDKDVEVDAVAARLNSVDDLEKKLMSDEIDAPVDTPDLIEQRRARTAWIPILTFSAGLLTALGSGMTVKFFPLFFKNDCDMSPSGVQAICLLAPLVILSFAKPSQKLSETFGRVQTIIFCGGIGVTALFLMVYLEKYRGDWRVMVPIYLFRTGIMNCTYPLEESIAMDFVPKDQRARWKSLDSVCAFGWCGSAALGGVLADKYGYAYTFLITAIVQGAGLLLWATLIPLVPRNEMKSLASTKH